MDGGAKLMFAAVLVIMIGVAVAVMIKPELSMRGMRWMYKDGRRPEPSRGYRTYVRVFHGLIIAALLVFFAPMLFR